MALKIANDLIPAAVTLTVLSVSKFGPRVSVLSALPLVSVVAVALVSVPSPRVMVNSTETPGNGAPASSCISTMNGSDNAANVAPSWLSPETFIRATCGTEAESKIKTPLFSRVGMCLWIDW